MGSEVSGGEEVIGTGGAELAKEGTRGNIQTGRDGPVVRSDRRSLRRLSI